MLLASAGAYLAYQNTLPTTLATNFKNGQKDVPTDGRVLLTFSRPVSLAAVQAAFSISPTPEGTLAEISGQTQYAWSPTKPLNELTAYTVSMKPIYDVGRHRIQGSTWTFTTIIVPHVISIVGPAGPLTDGMEVDPGATLKLNFNDAMEPTTIKVTIGTQVADLKWTADDKSATFSTAGIPSGPLQIQLAAGGRDQTGHLVPGAFTLKSGNYYHDREHTTALRYPALIQIPNDEFARDQNGLQAADIIFEYLAEGGITRLTAIYQNAPDLIGPMRSARFISLKLGRHYKGLLFQSGESQATRNRAAQDPTPQFFDTIGYQFRAAPPRYAPDNLMIRGPSVKAAQWHLPEVRRGTRIQRCKPQPAAAHRDADQRSHQGVAARRRRRPRRAHPRLRHGRRRPHRPLLQGPALRRNLGVQRQPWTAGLHARRRPGRDAASGPRLDRRNGLIYSVGRSEFA